MKNRSLKDRLLSLSLRKKKNKVPQGTFLLTGAWQACLQKRQAIKMTARSADFVYFLIPILRDHEIIPLSPQKEKQNPARDIFVDPRFKICYRNLTVQIFT